MATTQEQSVLERAEADIGSAIIAVGEAIETAPSQLTQSALINARIQLVSVARVIEAVRCNL